MINRLFSSFCLAFVCFHLVLIIPESIRIMGGPLNETFCSIRILLQKFLGFYCFLTFDAITLIRYTYIFKVANFAVIDDDFVTKCSVLSNIILSAWCVGVMHMNPGAYPVIDMMCAGGFPNQNGWSTYDPDEPTKISTEIIILVGSVGLQLFVNTKIFIFKRKERQAAAALELGTLNNNNGIEINGPQQNSQKSLFDKSIVSLSTQVLIVVIGILAFVTNIIFELRMRLAIHDPKKLEYLLFFKMTVMNILALSACLTYFWQNEAFRDFLKRKITILLQRNGNI